MLTLLQRPACTKLTAIHLVAYAAERSTFVGSFPENAPPPCGQCPPYVSTMILRPVNPASASGPPFTKCFDGLMMNLVSSSTYFSGTIFLISLIRMALICSWVMSGSCWCETRMVWALSGMSSPFNNCYWKVTCDLASGLSQLSSPDFLLSDKTWRMSCDNLRVMGIYSSVSLVAYPNTWPWSPAPNS